MIAGRDGGRIPSWFVTADARITEWMARHGVTLTRVALGVVFLWFGVIKFVPGWSPAEALAGRTIERASFGLIGPAVAVPMLAVWETAIGLGLLTRRFLRLTLGLLFVQMPGTMLPLVLFPQETFLVFPYAPTIEGQYIIKNLVLVSAAIVVGATVRGGRLEPR
jgi:uncharacterized membrane protein YkgB